MKVKDLIEELSKHSGDTEVGVECLSLGNLLRYVDTSVKLSVEQVYGDGLIANKGASGALPLPTVLVLGY